MKSTDIEEYSAVSQVETCCYRHATGVVSFRTLQCPFRAAVTACLYTEVRLRSDPFSTPTE